MEKKVVNICEKEALLFLQGINYNIRKEQGDYGGYKKQVETGYYRKKLLEFK